MTANQRAVPPEGTYLGLDFGTRHLGVAVGQTITRRASPLQSLDRRHKRCDAQLADLIQQWQPVGLVLGLPLNMDGSEQSLTQQARAFGQALAAQSNLPLFFQDERLSTQEVRSQLFEEAGYKALQKNTIDQRSAQVILESWLQQGDKA